MVYDYVITKPELNEETLMHFGIKGMKWRKRLGGKYYGIKSKHQGLNAKIKRKVNGINNPEEVSSTTKAQTYITTSNGKKILNLGKRNFTFSLRTDSGKSNSHSGQEGLRDVKTTKVGKKDRPLARKKKVVAGKGSVKKRK